MIFTILDTLQLKKFDDCENIYSVNPLHLIIGKVDRHIECEKNGSKYLVFDSTDEKKEVRSTQNFGMGLKLKLKQ